MLQLLQTKGPSQFWNGTATSGMADEREAYCPAFDDNGANKILNLAYKTKLPGIFLPRIHHYIALLEKNITKNFQSTNLQKKIKKEEKSKLSR